MTGTVTLVGAGVGNAGLLTIDGLRALRAADCVIYDRLLGDGVIELIPDRAEKIYAGKADSHHLLPQYIINEILIKKAKEGRAVVRLKGGDSYLFGRGGEEAEALFKADVPFKVIPGVCSAVAVPALGGIPVTHRDASSALHIITGHKKDGSLDIDFKAYAQIGGTLVFLMGLKNLGAIAKGLIDGGMSADTPCAVIENGGSANQKKAVSSLESIEEAAVELKSPCVIVVGRVCKYAHELDWFSHLPLKGKKIIIARPRSRSKGLGLRLKDLGAEVGFMPCIDFKALDCDFLRELKECEAVVFTSAAGVKYAFEGIFKRGLDSRILGGKALAAIGDKTAAELLGYGLVADIVPKKHNGGELAGAIAKGGFKKVLILRAEKAAAGLTEGLKAADISYKDRAVYRTVIKEAKYKGGADFVIFASPSEAEAFSDCPKDFTGVCIGGATADKAKALGIRCITAEAADDDGLVKAVLKAVKP